MTNQKKEIDRYERYVDDAIHALKQLNRPAIAHLLRATLEPNEIDGYPVGLSSEVHSSGTSDPAGEAAIARLTSVRSDPLLHAAQEALASIHEMAGHAAIIAKRTAVVVHAGDSVKDRSSIGQCQACQREVPGTPADRLRAGYDAACYSAWIREGRPDRRQFEIRRSEIKVSA